jgi:FAD-dependent oxidoreductase domain-containing protein 1
MQGPNDQSADIVIVGGAVIGSAIAYYLATLGTFRPNQIVIVEKDFSFATASTSLSAGGIRQQFSTPENIALSLATLELVRAIKETFGADADVGFKEHGYLVLASSGGSELQKRNVAIQRSCGGDIDLMLPEALTARFPWLNVDDIASGAFGLSGEGWVDPTSLMTLFRNAAKARGVSVVADTVVGIERDGQRVAAVRLASGLRIACGAVVNAAGHAAGAVAALAGVTLPVEPRKRFVYVLDCRDALPELHQAPLTVDPSGVWFRPEGRQFLAGISPDEANEPPAGDLTDIDYAPFEEIVWPSLAARVPAFEAVKMTGAWAGYYDYNTLDQNAVLGAHPDVANFYFANGFSGHGLQQSAGAGRAIAELIIHGRYQAIDLTRLGYERIARREPLLEQNIF